LRIQADQRRKLGEIDFRRSVARYFKRGQFSFRNASGVCRHHARYVAHRPSFADDVAEMVFEIHGKTLAARCVMSQAFAADEAD
jgi:hypothetical protein